MPAKTQTARGITKHIIATHCNTACR